MKHRWSNRALLLTLLAICACVGGPADDRPAAVKSAADKAPAATAESPSDKERADYLPRIQLRNLEAHPVKSPLDGKTGASVSGEVKNTGDRTVTEVQITIYLLDKDGKPVSEHQLYAAIEGEPIMARDAGPIKPNYTRRFGGGFDVPSDWGGKVEAKITDVKLAAK